MLHSMCHYQQDLTNHTRGAKRGGGGGGAALAGERASHTRTAQIDVTAELEQRSPQRITFRWPEERGLAQEQCGSLGSSLYGDK